MKGGGHRSGSRLRAVAGSPAGGPDPTADDDGRPSVVVAAVAAEEPTSWTVLLRVPGRLDRAAGVELSSILDARLAAPGVHRVLIDLLGVRTLTADGLSVLHRAQRECRVRGLRLVLIGTGNPAVHRLLYLSGLLPIVDSLPTVQAALSTPPRPPSARWSRDGRR